MISHDCKEGTLDNDCDGCITEEISGYDHLIYWLTEGGCGKEIFALGKLEETLDHLLDEVFPEIERTIGEMTNGLISLTRERERTGIVGFSLGGLASCHAAWTRPEVSKVF